MGKETRNKAPRQEHELEPEIPVEQEEVQDQDTGQPGEESSEPPKSEQELLQEKYDQLQDQHLRLMAEYDNYRKRTQKEKDDIYQAATAAALQKILPMQDNFDRAGAFECHTEEFAKGFALIEKGFAELLSSFGVEAFGEAGEPFDPELHHAVMHIEDESLGENVIAQVLQKGYRMGDKVLRYAMVQTAN